MDNLIYWQKIADITIMDGNFYEYKGKKYEK